MSDTATKQTDGKSATKGNLLSPDAGLILRGVVTTFPENNSFTSKQGKTFHSLKFSVTDGKNTFPCKIASDTGDDFPNIQPFQPNATFRVVDAYHDSYNGITYTVVTM